MSDAKDKIKKAILKCPAQYKPEFKTSKCSVTISVGQTIHEGEKFKATLAAVNASFKECTIMICDSLQRHTLKIDANIGDVHTRANELGVEWLKRNEEAIKQLEIQYNIIHWDHWLSHPQYKIARKQIDKLFLDNNEFKAAVENTALSFLERNINKINTSVSNESVISSSCDYLKEECAVMLIWAQNDYHFEVYPSPRNLAMRFVYENVISKDSPNLVREVSVKYKNTVLTNKIDHFFGDNKMDLEANFPALATLVNLLPGHVYVLDVNNIYRGCNELQAKYFGVDDIKDVIGKKNKDMPIFAKRPDLAEITDNNNSNIMGNNKSELVELEEVSPTLTSEIAIFKSYKLPLLNKDNKVIGLLGISYDITNYKHELKVLQDKYTQNELALDNIMANLPGHVYWTDENNNFLGCNDQQAHDFGLKTRHEIIGLSTKLFQTPENAVVIIKNNNAVIKDGKVITTEEKFKDMDGAEKVYLSRKTPLRDKTGKVVGLLGISFDITDRKEKEKLELENQVQQASLKTSEEFKKCMDEIQHTIELYKRNVLNKKIGVKLGLDDVESTVVLTKREREILYYLSLNKSPKDIAGILSILENKKIAPATIQSIINKHLYPKFGIFNIGSLIEKARVLKLIPFLPED